MVKERKKIRYSRKWVNPLYWIIEDLIKQGVLEFYIYGGKGSAKTVTIGQIVAKRCLHNNQKAICFRKETSTIKTTLKPSYEKSVESIRLDKYYKFLEFEIRSKTNRASLTFKGIDKAQKVKGIEGYADTHHDELDQFTYQDYTESVNAHRGEVAKVKFFSWNPVDINSWIKTKVLDVEEWRDTEYTLPSPHSFVKINKDGTKAMIKTVYHDNYWLTGSPCGTYGYKDVSTINRYEKMKEVDEQWYNVNVLGEWGVIKPDNPFFARFDRAKHIRKNLQISPYLPIALSFDFNVKNSVVAFQFSLDEHYVRFLKEWRLYGIDLSDLVVAVIRYFGKDREYIITGDASGKNQSALTKGNIGAYGIIKQVFEQQQVSYTMEVPAANMSLINSRAVNNAILYFEDDYFIDEDECPELISDIERMKAATDGGLDKKDADSKNYGHLGDCFRYANQVLLLDFWRSYDIPQLDDIADRSDQ